VLADETQLYEDANGDRILYPPERKARGVIVITLPTLAERQQLAKEREDAWRAMPPTALFTQRPKLDRPVAAPR
jgi:hypothetical protein